ncbi:MAG: class I SAM-dependent methyltransferase [Candidatus Omnitrophica bacterium]|nr:class I SAM-dependent methyltransferase [Candidatus Omnitrophota bacterium]
MFVSYKHICDYQSVDIGRLRGKGSYKTLMEKRAYFLKIVGDRDQKVRGEFLQERLCPLCDADDHRCILEKDGLKIVKCSKCEMIYVNPVLSTAALEKIYKHEDYSEIMEKLQGESHQYRKSRFGKERVETVKRLRDDRLDFKKWLDIGCSTGFVLEAAKEEGWDAVGVELNPYAVRFARGRGIKVIDRDYLGIRFGESEFSEITIFDVLEHLPNPSDVLRKAFKELTQYGGVYIYVPNWESASRILMGDDAHFIWPSHHLAYFTPFTVTKMLESIGFEVIRVETEGLDIFDYIWFLKDRDNEKPVSYLEEIADKLQFFINAGLYGKNLRVYAKKTGGKG